jgi:hypothetical protein
VVLHQFGPVHDLCPRIAQIVHADIGELRRQGLRYGDIGP